MTLTQLNYFCEIAKTNSFTIAANNLFVAQPSVSFAIRELESELGAPLFVRSTNRKVELTEFGTAFLPYAQASLSSIEDGRRKVQRMLNPDAGNVRIGIYVNTSTDLVPLFINDFRREYPDSGIEFDLDVNYSWVEDLHEQLIRGTYDMIITSSKDEVPNCKSQHIATQQVKLLIPVGHELDRIKDPITFEMLTEYTLLCVSPNSYMDKHIKRLFAAKGITPKIYYSTDWTSLLTDVAIGKGIALTTMLPINPDILTYVDVDEPDNKRNIFISWPTNRPLSAPTKLLLDHFLKISTQLGAENLIF